MRSGSLLGIIQDTPTLCVISPFHPFYDVMKLNIFVCFCFPSHMPLLVLLLIHYFFVNVGNNTHFKLYSMLLTNACFLFSRHLFLIFLVLYL